MGCAPKCGSQASSRSGRAPLCLAQARLRFCACPISRPAPKRDRIPTRRRSYQPPTMGKTDATGHLSASNTANRLAPTRKNPGFSPATSNPENGRLTQSPRFRGGRQLKLGQHPKLLDTYMRNGMVGGPPPHDCHRPACRLRKCYGEPGAKPRRSHWRSRDRTIQYSRDVSELRLSRGVLGPPRFRGDDSESWGGGRIPLTLRPICDSGRLGLLRSSSGRSSGGRTSPSKYL